MGESQVAEKRPRLKTQMDNCPEEQHLRLIALWAFTPVHMFVYLHTCMHRYTDEHTHMLTHTNKLNIIP